MGARNQPGITASAEHAGFTSVGRPLLNQRGIRSAQKGSPSRGFPGRTLKRNKVADMRSQRNAAIATSISKAAKGKSLQNFEQLRQQTKEQQLIFIDTQNRGSDRGSTCAHEPANTGGSQAVKAGMPATQSSTCLAT